jgi:hypothetical protein
MRLLLMREGLTAQGAGMMADQSSSSTALEVFRCRPAVACDMQYIHHKDPSS